MPRLLQSLSGVSAETTLLLNLIIRFWGEKAVLGSQVPLDVYRNSRVKVQDW